MPEPNEENAVPSYYHKSVERDLELAIGDSESIETIADHFEKHFGPVTNVFHELVSDLVHIDVHFIAPSAERPYHLLFTTGMSDRPMPVARPDLETYQFAELMLCLPPTWKLSENEFRNPENYWPIRWLKFLARFPHQYQTWLFLDHTVPNGEQYDPLGPGTELSCWWLAPPFNVSEDFSPLSLPDGRVIHFLNIVPLYKEEAEINLRGRIEKLLAYFDQHHLTQKEVQILNPTRRRPLARKKRFGLF